MGRSSFVSAPRDERIWGQLRANLGADTVVSATAGANNYYDGFPSPAFYFHKQLDKLQGGSPSVSVTWCGKVFAMPL